MNKKIVIVALVIVGLVAVATLGVQMWAQHKVRAIIEQSVSGIGARVSLGRVGVNPFARAITLHDIRISAQPRDPLADRDSSGIVSFGVNIKRIRARGVNVKTLNVSSLTTDISSASLATAKGDKHSLVELFGSRIDVSDLATGHFTADSIVCSFGTGESDQNHISLREIACEGIDVARIIAQKALSIDSVKLGGTRLKSYKNRQIYEAPRHKPLLWQTIQALPIPVEIRHIAFLDADIEYDELSATGDSPGVVTLDDMHGEARNMTNIAEGNERFFRVDLQTVLMGEGDFVATCLFPVDAADDHWEVSGRLGATDLRSFNQALEPLMNVRIDSCNLQSLDFQIIGTHIESSVNLTMLYTDLNVELLRRHDHTRKLGLPTLVLDNFVLKHANPLPGQSVRQGSGTHTHDYERSTFNFIWKSVVPGVTRTVL